MEERGTGTGRGTELRKQDRRNTGKKKEMSGRPKARERGSRRIDADKQRAAAILAVSSVHRLGLVHLPGWRWALPQPNLRYDVRDPMVVEVVS
mmetsp:Transcript_153/g.267  ORF Transcript_153/g.267 Transcript_153/m.267 type:complete len:93 (-) Transcript_153:704-982(-)